MKPVNRVGVKPWNTERQNEPKENYNNIDNLKKAERPPCLEQWSSSLFIYLFLKFIYFIYLFLGVLGLCCCTLAFSSCGERGLLFVAVRGLLIAVSSLVAEHRL